MIKQKSSSKSQRVVPERATGWYHELLQDNSRELSEWLSTRLDSLYRYKQQTKEQTNGKDVSR